MAQYSNTLSIGSRLEEYRIESILGTGGFGVTYKAWDTHLETWVAIKEYFPIEWSFRGRDGVAVHPTTQGRQRTTDGTLSDYEWGLNRFLDEARILARIKNVFVVRINRYFRANGTAYIVMDYEEGEPLSALLERQGILSENDILGLLQEVLPALQAVHDQGYLHRDLKPGNLYVRSRDGCVMLIDFGAARQAIGRSSKSVTGLVTPGYSPPEQYAIRSDRYGNWTDIYALGAVLYRCISGAAPVEAAERLINDSLKPARECGAGRYNPELLAVVDKALALRPDDRYQSVAEIWQELNISMASERSTTAVADTPVNSGEFPKEPKSQVSGPSLSGVGARPPSWGRIAAMVVFLMLGAAALLWVPLRSVFVTEQPPSSIPIADDSAADNPVVESIVNNIDSSSTDFTSRADEITHSIDEARLNNVVLAPVVAIEPNASDELAKGLLALKVNKNQDDSAEPVVAEQRLPDFAERSESELEKLLRLAGESFDADRLTTPYEESALTYFEQALKLDPDNQSARRGIDKIVQRYVMLTRGEMDKPDYVKAHRFIARGLAIDADNQQLLEMAEHLDALTPVPVTSEVESDPAPQPDIDLEMALNPDSR